MNIQKLEDMLWVITRGFGMAIVVGVLYFFTTNIIEAEFRDMTPPPISESRYGQVTVVNPEENTTKLSYHGPYIYSYSETSDEFTIVENETIHKFNHANGDNVIFEEVI